MKPTILITGASGMVGRDLVPLLHASSEANLVLLLHQRGADMDEDRFVHTYHGLLPSNRIRIVQGDITKADLSLPLEVRKALAKSITHILHAAASTRLNLPLEEARQINLDGTRHMVALAQDCTRLQRFGYVSTAYVSGQRTGIIREEELQHEAGFVNSYEQSKYEAECFMQSVQSTLPAAIYRLSIVLGDSRTGVVTNMTAPHQTMRLIYHGLASMLPGSPDSPVDFIPADVAAATLCRLFLDAFRPGDTFHITAGPEKSYTLSTIIDEIYGTFAALDPGWCRLDFPKPVLASIETFDSFLKSMGMANPSMQGALSAVRQISYPKIFDRENLTRALPDYDEGLPDIRQYFRKVVGYCLQSQWGRKAA